MYSYKQWSNSFKPENIWQSFSDQQLLFLSDEQRKLTNWTYLSFEDKEMVFKTSHGAYTEAMCVFKIASIRRISAGGFCLTLPSTCFSLKNLCDVHCKLETACRFACLCRWCMLTKLLFDYYFFHVQYKENYQECWVRRKNENWYSYSSSIFFMVMYFVLLVFHLILQFSLHTILNIVWMVYFDK